MLIVTCIIIVFAIYGIFYFFFKITFGRKERYFQFDTGNNQQEDVPRIGGLEKIEEEAEGEDTNTLKAQQMRKVSVSTATG